MSRVVKVVAWIWLVVAGLLVVAGHAMVLIKEGFWAMADLLSPFNVINYVMIIAALLPGILLLALADKLKAARK